MIPRQVASHPAIELGLTQVFDQCLSDSGDRSGNAGLRTEL